MTATQLTDCGHTRCATAAETTVFNTAPVNSGTELPEIGVMLWGMFGHFEPLNISCASITCKVNVLTKAVIFKVGHTVFGTHALASFEVRIEVV